MMCGKYQVWIKQAALGRLDRSRQAKLNIHLAGCAGCRELLAAEQRLVTAIDRGLAESLTGQPSPEFAARVRMRLAAAAESGWRQPRWAFNTWITVGAAGIAVAAVIVIVPLLQRPQPALQTIRASVPSAPAQITSLAKREEASGLLAAALHPKKLSRHVRPVAARRWPSRLRRQRQAPQLQVLVQPGQWATLVALSREAQSGRVDASSLNRDAKEEELPVEIKPVEIKPLATDDSEEMSPIDSPGL